ncbi:MAG: hypothetical protein QM831_26195 [Kofleriaceae bacterium]
MRVTLLGALAAFVVIATAYLLIEVRSTPASASVASVTPHPNVVSPPPETSDDSKPSIPAAHGPHFNGGAPPAPKVDRNGDPPPEETTDDTLASLDKANPKLDAIMDQANKHYDHGEYEDAKAIAGKVLAKSPTNFRMMRIMVSASCIDGDTAVAQKWFELLPKADREQMKTRCDKYSVTLKDPPQ